MSLRATAAVLALLLAQRQHVFIKKLLTIQQLHLDLPPVQSLGFNTDTYGCGVAQRHQPGGAHVNDAHIL